MDSDLLCFPYSPLFSKPRVDEKSPTYEMKGQTERTDGLKHGRTKHKTKNMVHVPWLFWRGGGMWGTKYEVLYILLCLLHKKWHSVKSLIFYYTWDHTIVLLYINKWYPSNTAVVFNYTWMVQHVSKPITANLTKIILHTLYYINVISSTNLLFADG